MPTIEFNLTHETSSSECSVMRLICSTLQFVPAVFLVAGESFCLAVSTAIDCATMNFSDVIFLHPFEDEMR